MISQYHSFYIAITMLLQRIEYQVVAKVLFAYSSDTGK